MRRLVTQLLLVASAACAAVAPYRAFAQSCSAEFCALDMNSRIWVNNNTWGSESSPAGWWESITIQGANSFRTDFNWPSGANNNSVKAYPAAILGWHWGFRKTGTGLPTQLSANQNVNSNYSYSVNFGGGVGNVAYDCWLHTQSNPTWEHQPSDELMIWVNTTGGAGAIGSYIAYNIPIGGSTWNLKRGNIGWEVWSFVRTSNSSSGSVNIKNFTDYLRNTYGLSSSKYLSSVQFGTEIFRGTGNLNVSNYTCTVGGGGGSQTIPNGTYRLVARHSGKSADVTGGGTANGTNVAQWANGSGSNQRWNVTHLGSGQYQIQSVSANKALDANGSGTANGTNVQIWTYGGGNNQRWTITPTSGGYHRVSPVHAPSLALDVAGNSTADGANIQLWSYGGGNNQQWAFQTP